MHQHEKSFISRLTPEEILGRFRKLSSEKGWEVISEDPTMICVQTGVTVKSAGENIEVSVDAKSDGTRVRLVVKPRLGALQVIDWGEGSEFEHEVVERLST